jgi:hypothetical protein
MERHSDTIHTTANMASILFAVLLCMYVTSVTDQYRSSAIATCWGIVYVESFKRHLPSVGLNLCILVRRNLSKSRKQKHQVSSVSAVHKQ